MFFKIILSNTKDEIKVRTDEELARIIQGVSSGSKIVFCKEGSFNPSYLVAILPDNEGYSDEFKYLNSEQRVKREQELLSEPSIFAKALSGSMTMINDPTIRTQIQEEVSREERMLK